MQFIGSTKMAFACSSADDVGAFYYGSRTWMVTNSVTNKRRTGHDAQQENKFRVQAVQKQCIEVESLKKRCK